MSLRQGNNILAGGVVCDNTPTSGSTNALSSGGAYTALSGKVDKGHEVIDFQEPTAENNYTWYRKYDDGWVEQGGLFPNTASSYSVWTANLPVEMSSAYYNANAICFVSGTNYTPQINSRTTTSVTFDKMLSNTAYGACWEVKGMAAN